MIQQGEREVGEDSVQQQHDGVVMVEERGTPAGLRQALQETRRERGRAAPTGEELRVLGCPFASTIYKGRGRAVPPPRVPSLGVAAAPIPIWGGGQVGGEGGAPGMGL